MTHTITSHAISRYRERVEPVDYDTAYAALSRPAILLAVSIGAPFVKLSGGQRVVIEGGAVVTVLPKEHKAGLMGRSRDKAA